MVIAMNEVKSLRSKLISKEVTSLVTSSTIP